MTLDFEMLAKVAALGEGLPTLVTCKQLLAHVRAPMLDEG